MQPLYSPSACPNSPLIHGEHFRVPKPLQKILMRSERVVFTGRLEHSYICDDFKFLGQGEERMVTGLTHCHSSHSDPGSSMFSQQGSSTHSQEAIESHLPVNGPSSLHQMSQISRGKDGAKCTTQPRIQVQPLRGRKHGLTFLHLSRFTCPP
jgi:hypothetical protein